MATRDEALAALSVYYNHALGAYGYSDDLIERMKCVIDTVAARVRAEAMEQAAKLVQDYYTHGDNTQGWQDIFAERIRSLINKASEGADSKEKQG